MIGYQVMDLFLPIAQGKEEGFCVELGPSLSRVAGSDMRMKLHFCEIVQHGREDTGLGGLMDHFLAV